MLLLRIPRLLVLSQGLHLKLLRLILILVNLITLLVPHTEIMEALEMQMGSNGYGSNLKTQGMGHIDPFYGVPWGGYPA